MLGKKNIFFKSFIQINNNIPLSHKQGFFKKIFKNAKQPANLCWVKKHLLNKFDSNHILCVRIPKKFMIKPILLIQADCFLLEFYSRFPIIWVQMCSQFLHEKSWRKWYKNNHFLIKVSKNDKNVPIFPFFPLETFQKYLFLPPS